LSNTIEPLHIRMLKDLVYDSLWDTEESEHRVVDDFSSFSHVKS